LADTLDDGGLRTPPVRVDLEAIAAKYRAAVAEGQMRKGTFSR